MARRAALYRLFDADGQLLYIGISDVPSRRFTQHAYDKPWWPEVVRKSLEWHPDRVSVENAEALAIRSEGPKYNVRKSGVRIALLDTIRLAKRGKIPSEEVEERMDNAIADTLADGWSVDDVAFVTGLSRERIRQIRNRVENDRARASLQRRAEAGEAPPPF